MTKNIVMVWLFAAHYAESDLSITQNCNGTFYVWETTANGVSRTETNWEDVCETISECLAEQADGECEVSFISEAFKQRVYSLAL
jgi:uncharacterized Fe-S center protein